MAINFYSDIHLGANKLGRDADNLLDFSTDNEITFRVGAGNGVVFKASGEIEATKFDGALEGNADTATLATTVTVTDNESTNENNVIPFLANAETETGNHALEMDGDLTYNPSSGTVTAGRFSGSLVGNADTATALASARTIGGVSFDGTGNITLPGVNAEGNQNTTGRALHVYVADNESTDEENLITFVENGQTGTGGHGLEMDGDLTYNPSTGTLTATLFNGKNKFAPTGSNTAGTVSGGDVVYFGGEEHTIAAGQLVHYNSSGNWELADADAASTSDGLLGIALGGDASADGVLLRGMVTIDHDPGAIGDVLYLSTTAGDCSSTAPSGSGDIVRIIGYQVNHASNGEIWFNPSADFILLA